jgi:hypothetical protein
MRLDRLQLGTALILAAASPLAAQTRTDASGGFQDLPPTSGRADEAPAPELLFRLEAEIPLPGPLPGVGPRLRGELIEIGVAGGVVLTPPTADAEPRFLPAEDAGPADSDGTAWITDESGRRRYRALPGGTIEAQRRCRRCKAGWKKRWKLRVAGNTLAAPVAADGRVYFGALDNRVYCVKAANGHRIWATDVGARVSSRVVHWRGPVGGAADAQAASDAELSLILVIPDGGAEMIGLEIAGGQPIASVRLPDGEGKLAGEPLATPEGTIVVARQRYAESDASLLVYAVQRRSPSEADSTNEPSPVPLAASGAPAVGR